MRYPDLSILANPSSLPAMLKIGLIAPELLGPVHNSGIATANTFLAQELAMAGHAVSILFTQCETSARASESWMVGYRQLGIEVTVAEEWIERDQRVSLFPNHPPLFMAHTVDRWLTENSFDLVILTDWQGHGFYALQAKRGGLRYQQTAFITLIHRPSLWHALHNADLPTDPIQSLTYFMERKSIELADAVISPSQYMMDWVKQHDFKPPRWAFVQPHLLRLSAPVKKPNNSAITIKEFVFFGRLEYRKGLLQFCNALDRLEALGFVPDRVTFLGRLAWVGHEHAALMIAQRAQSWSFPYQILSTMGQREALSYLGESAGRLAVMPSVAENSPYTVCECLAAGIPFIASNVGGIAELIAPADQGVCLFNDNPRQLAGLLAKILNEGATQIRSSYDAEQNRINWLQGLLALTNQINAMGSTATAVASYPSVTVCLTHYNRPKLLKQAIDSLLQQDYPNLEVLLVDDGSSKKKAHKALEDWEPEFIRRGWKILRLENGYLGRARNRAVQAARSDFLVFMDDDNVARPDMVSRFMKVALSANAELVTTMFEVFSGEKMPDPQTPVVTLFLPVGDILSFSVMNNAFGDANALIRRSLFEKLGGFSEDYGLGHEDLELFLRSAMIGANVAVVPEPLFWYRKNGESMLSSTLAAANRIRSFRPYVDHLPAPLAELAVLAHGLATERMPQSAAASELVSTDHQRLANGCQDAPETLVAVINTLKSMGHGILAQSILNDQTRPNSDGQLDGHLVPVDSMLARVLEATEQQNLQQLQGLLAGIKGAAANKVRANVCFTALSTIEGLAVRAEVVELLVECLVQAMPNNFEALLTGAKHLLAVNSVEMGLTHLFAALAIADADYLRFRPDVGAAVKRKHFDSGLEHYCYHGRAEGIPWPGNRGFIAIWPQLANVTAMNRLPNTLSAEYQAMLLLVLRAFEPIL